MRPRVRCSKDGIESAHLGSVILRGKRPFATGVAPRAAWFTVAASGGAVTVNGAAFSPDDAHELKLTLSRDIGADETVTVSYARPPGVRGLWDVDGNQLADVVDLPVTNDATDAPAVDAMALVSDPGADRTYAAGDAIRVRATFGEAVTVDTAQGAPRLRLDLGGEEGAGERWAAYASGSGEAALSLRLHGGRRRHLDRTASRCSRTRWRRTGARSASAAGADAALGHKRAATPTPGTRWTRRRRRSPRRR